MHVWRTSKKPDHQWYVGVLCERCEVPILFGLDRSRGQGPISPSVKLVLTCGEPECGQQADYTDAAIARFQRNEGLAEQRGSERVS